MNKMAKKLLVFLLVLAIGLPAAAVTQKATTASAASVALTTTRKTVVVGNTYTVALKDSSNVSRRSFYSYNTKVATVNGKGLVTAIAPGTAKIRCTVLLKTGARVSVYCTITVKSRIPATSIKFKNVIQDEINAHIMEVGDKYDFNMQLSPSTSTDSSYFTIADSDIASVSWYGVVTAKKPGVTVLEAKAGLNYTDSKRTTNTVSTKTYIYVKPKKVVTTPTPTPTPTVDPKAIGVNMVSSLEIKVSFNTPIDKSSVIDANGNLVAGAIVITPGIGANPVGMIAAQLSSDQKSLYLTSTSEFKGTYVVTVFNKVMTTDGQLVEADSFPVDLKDTVGPSYVDSVVLEDGYTCQINFSEALDISKMMILSVNGTNNDLIKSRLTSAGNYTLSQDKKSLLVNMSGCNESVFNVMVDIVGIRDLKGNQSNPYQINALVKADASGKAPANIISAVRESKTALKVTFDQPIQIPGLAQVDTSFLVGTVDSTDKRIVRYNITNTAITGNKLIIIKGYQNYNMVVVSGEVSRSAYADFTLDTTPPIIVSSEFATDTVNGKQAQVLKLTYNKNITAVNGSGSLTALINSINADIYTKEYIYTAVASANQLTLTFEDQVFEAGNYTITIPSGMVMDKLENLSREQKIGMVKQSGTGNKLPAPLSVVQDAKNPSKVQVTFGAKLDTVSAQISSNYIINGTIVPTTARIISQSETNAVVELTFAPSAFVTTGVYNIQIGGIKGYNNKYGVMDTYNSIITLVQNQLPQVTLCKVTSTTMVEMDFTNDITGDAVFMIESSQGIQRSSGVFINGRALYITFPSPITDSAILTIIENNIKDSSNNIANIPEKITAVKSY